MKHVTVSAEFVNMVPAHDRYVTKSAVGSTVTVAIGRAVDAIFKDDRVKGKRVTYPIKFRVDDGKSLSDGDE
jgi:hypothetical protein